MEKKKPGRKTKKPKKEQFETLYSVMSAREVADHFGVSASTIYQWARQFRKEDQGGGYKINEKKESHLTPL